MNILFVTNIDPRLKNSGSAQRTNLLWESLKRHGRVFSYFADDSTACDEEHIEGEHPLYRFNAQTIKSPFWHPLHSVLENLSVFSIFRYKKYKYPDPCSVFGNVKFDLVVVRYIGTACFYKFWKIAPMIIDIDDYPIQVYDTTKGLKRKFLTRSLGSWLTRIQTEHIIKKAQDCWIANSTQTKLFGHQFIYLPNISNEPSESYDYAYPEREGLFTVGNMSYAPNYEGTDRFLKEIWPAFHKEHPDVRYRIAGKGAPSEYALKWNSLEGVEYLGFVDDIEDLYKKCLATVVPIYGGGGTCIKTLESLSYSRTCLSMPFGLRGLPENILDGKHGLIAVNNSDDLIRAYDSLNEKEKRSDYEHEGRTYFKANHTKSLFERAVDRLLSKYTGLIH